MLIEVQFDDAVPRSMAGALIEALRDHFALFGAAGKMTITFEPGEEERLIETENAPRK